MPTISKHRPPHIFPDNLPIFITARIYGGFSYLHSQKMKNYFWQLLKDKALKYGLNLKARVVLNNHYHLITQAKEGKTIPKFIKEVHGASAREIKKNLPREVVNHSQLLVREITSWDKRQERRLKNQLGVAKTGLAHFSARSDRRLKSASPAKDALAKFILRYKSRFKPKTYRGLKSAITEGRITDSEILVALVSKDRPVWYQYLDHALRNEADYYRHINYIHQNPVKHGLVNKMSDYKWSSIHEFVKKKGKEWVIDCFRDYPIIDFQPTGIAD